MTVKVRFFQRIPIFLVMFVLMIKIGRSEDKKHRLPAVIYYSVTDPESVKFLKSHLKFVTDTSLGESIDIDLLPFAGCKLAEDTKKVNCDSGENQVQASLHHMCALHLMNTKRPHSLSFNVDGLKYVICTMKKISNSSKQLDLEGCVSEAKGLTKDIGDCVKREGKDLVIESFKIIRELKFEKYPSVALEGRSFRVGVPLPLEIDCAKEPDRYECKLVFKDSYKKEPDRNVGHLSSTIQPKPTQPNPSRSNPTEYVPKDSASRSSGHFKLSLYQFSFSLLTLIFF